MLNLSGVAHLQRRALPFAEADARLARLAEEGADAVIVDFHCELTSEKVAMGWHLDGRVAACLGTHTHVPTADARVLPGGTAYISDVGMTGSRDGVIGVRARAGARGSFITQMPIRFEVAEGNVWINAAPSSRSATTGSPSRSSRSFCRSRRPARPPRASSYRQAAAAPEADSRITAREVRPRPIGVAEGMPRNAPQG